MDVEEALRITYSGKMQNVGDAAIDVILALRDEVDRLRAELARTAQPPSGEPGYEYQNGYEAGVKAAAERAGTVINEFADAQLQPSIAYMVRELAKRISAPPQVTPR